MRNYFVILLLGFISSRAAPLYYAVRVAYVVVSLCFLDFTLANCQSTYDYNTVSDSLVASQYNTSAYEISEILFVGNTFFASSELLDYITSKATQISIPNKILSTYYNESLKNKYFPSTYTEQLSNSLLQFNNEYHYFNQDIALSDVSSLVNYYNINGFHNVIVNYTFRPDSNKKKNILTFHINENPRYVLASKITYAGLAHLPKDVKQRFDTLVKLKAGDAFNETQIESEIKNVHSLLLRTGYMNSKWTYINVVTDSINFTDSIVAYFEPGNRIKIGKIIFVDSTREQKVLANSTKSKLIRFAEGGYYNKFRIERGIDNLLSTGVFESVKIDTLEGDYTGNDTTRDFVITSIYRKLKDWNAGLSFNETSIDRLLNLGVNAELLHRNIFGSAQATLLYSSISLKDIDKFLYNTDFPRFEFKIGASYTQPILWLLGNQRVALSSKLEYSWEILSGLFHISKISFPTLFPVSLPRSSYFSRLNIEFEIDREVPTNYEEIVSFALDSAKTLQDSNNVNSSLILYEKINNYLKGTQTHIFTSNILTLSLIGDNRDNLFNTTSGSMTSFTIDGFNPIFFPNIISGGAKYFRFQAIHTRFWKLSNVSTVGIKGKYGATYIFDEENSFIPQDRQFFAGGTNSVRAWPARELRYSFAQPGDAIAQFARNYIGSKTLIDCSVEYRRKLSDIPGISDNIAWIVNDLGIGIFLDFGNTFGWYIEDNTNKIDFKWTDYITKLAVGTGIGLRYETPIGPFRLDFATPLYDPLKKRRAFWDLTFVLGIGHAF